MRDDAEPDLLWSVDNGVREEARASVKMWHLTWREFLVGAHK